MQHVLKSWPAHFAAVASGRKTWEVRRDDRGFAVGDTLLLRRYNLPTKTYTGEEITMLVTYLSALPEVPGFVGMTVERVAP